MANELRLNIDILVDKAPMSSPVGFNIFRQLSNISSADVQEGLQLISHEADTAVQLGAAAGKCGYFAFRNTSETDRMWLKLGSAGDEWADIGPNQAGVLPIPADATPYARAQGSADVYLDYVIYSR